MGVLYYSTAPPVEIPERLLVHLKAVVTVKLRRNEPFPLTFARSDGDAVATTTIWLNPAIPLRFEFDTVQAEPLDVVLLQELAFEASTTRGLVVLLDPVSVPVLVGA